MMAKCGLCQVYTSSQMLLHDVFIGEESPTNALDLIRYCLSDVEDNEQVTRLMESINDTSTLCLGCYGKLMEMYKAIEVLNSVKSSIVLIVRNGAPKQEVHAAEAMKVESTTDVAPDGTVLGVDEDNEIEEHEEIDGESATTAEEPEEVALDADDYKEVDFLEECSSYTVSQNWQEQTDADLEDEMQLVVVGSNSNEASHTLTYDEELQYSESESQQNEQKVIYTEEYIIDELTMTEAPISLDGDVKEEGEEEYEELEVKQFHSDLNKCILKTKCKTKLYQCIECQLDFTHVRPYRQHRKEFHKAGFICDFCGKKFLSKAGFLAHRPLHKGTIFQCEVCLRTFKLKVSLQRHMSYHSGETPFHCDVCNKSFAHKIALKTHKKIHLNNRDKECNECQAKFLTNAHLKRHMLTHTGVRQHVCNICRKSFALAYNLRAHAREHHGKKRTRKARADFQDHGNFINLHVLAEQVLKANDESQMVMEKPLT